MRLLNDPTISLKIYGAGDAGYTAELKSLAHQLGLIERVVSFVGQVDGNAKSAAFLTADVCVVPSHTENFCMVVGEALAYGVPVVASRGTPWAAIEAKRCGLWVSNSPHSLAQAITEIRLLNLPEMGERGWSWIKAEYDWDAVAESMRNVYRGACEG